MKIITSLQYPFLQKVRPNLLDAFKNSEETQTIKQMAQPASEKLDKALQESGFHRDSNGDYHRKKADGGYEKVIPDGNNLQSSDNGWRLQEHVDGNRY